MRIKFWLLLLTVIITITACSANEDKETDVLDTATGEKEETTEENDQEEHSEEESGEEKINETDEKVEEQEEKESTQNNNSRNFFISPSVPTPTVPNVTVPTITVPNVSVSYNNNNHIVIEVPDYVLFDFDKSELKPEAEDVLREIGESLIEYEDTKVQINGHTDSQGSRSYNQTLSEKRAAEVKKYLVEVLEITHLDFQTRGFGQTQPITSNDTEEGRQKNRRVEIIIEVEE